MPRSFADSLRPFQRRLRLVAFVRYAPPALVTALAVAGVVLVVSRPSAVTAILACVVALSSALAAALGVAFRRTPSLAETARTADACFRLDDRVATALQFSEAPDPMSRLVVAEAAARLEATSPEGLPLTGDTSLRRYALTAFAIVTTVVIALSARVSSPSSTGGTEVANASGAGQGAASARTSGPAGAAGTSQQTQIVQGSPSQLPESGLRADQGSTQATPRADVPQAIVDGQARTPAGVARSAGAEGRAPGGTASAQSSLSAASGERVENGATTAAAGERPLSGAGRGGGDATSQGTSAGGISGGTLVDRADSATSISAAPAAGMATPAYRAAYARAMSAVVNQQVPPRLGTYVRDYFVAIRPQPDK